MRLIVPALLFVFMFCTNPLSRAAFPVELKTEQAVSPSQSTVANATARQTNIQASDVVSSLPRGRGNGSDAIKAFMFGFFAFIPFLGLPFMYSAYRKGIKNLGRIRKYRGFAIAGLVLATLGIVFTILILTA